MKQRLVKEFDIMELGKLKHLVLRRHILRKRSSYVNKSMTDLLTKTRKIGCKPVSALVEPYHKLGEVKEQPVKECIRGLSIDSYTLLTLD